MLVQKLTKQYKLFQHGFTHVIKFPAYTEQARIAQLYLVDQYGTIPFSNVDAMQHPWFDEFRQMRGFSRAYWIYVKDPIAITMIQLKLD